MFKSGLIVKGMNKENGAVFDKCEWEQDITLGAKREDEVGELKGR